MNLRPRALLPAVTLAALTLASFTPACAVGPAQEETLSLSSALTGGVSFDSTSPITTCSADEQTKILAAVGYARVLAASTPFQECVDHAMRGTVALSAEAAAQTHVATVGPYVPCLSTRLGGDEIPYAFIDQQVARVLSKVVTPNDLHVSCYPADGNSEGSADAYEVGTAPEVVAVSRFLLGTPPYPLSTSQTVTLSSVLLHEIMHQHDYHHGIDKITPTGSADEAIACGVSDPTLDPSWAREHTVPRIVNACIEELRVRAGHVCGGIDSCSPSSDGTPQLHLPQHFNDSTYCYCAADPLFVPPTSGGGGSSGKKCKGKTCYTTG